MTPFLTPSLNAMPIRPLPPPEPGYGLFATADGQQITLSIAGEDAMWADLCRLMDLGQYAALDEQARVARRSEIQPWLREAVARWPYQALYQRLEAEGIAFGPVFRPQEVFADAQLVSRRMTVDVDGPEGRRSYVRQPILFDGSGGRIGRPVPALGQHNAELLAPAQSPLTSG